MGVVYRAEDLRASRYVALKFLLAKLRTDDLARCHFCCEARAAAARLLPLRFREEGPDSFIAVASIEGRDLAVHAARNCLDVTQLFGLAAQLADGLAAAHQRGVIHLDVKASNVIVGLDGQPVRIDFGSASVRGAGRVIPRKRPRVTVAYTSPKEVAGDEIDCRAEICSLVSCCTN